MAIEILIIAVIGVLVFFAARYVIKQHKNHGCVGCSMAKQCGHNWKNCAKQNGGAQNKK